MLLTMYSAGLRRSELCRLKVSNIDSGRMMIRIERGKGRVDRQVPLNQKLLPTLRTSQSEVASDLARVLALDAS